MADDYTPLIEGAAREWNVDPTLLRALIQQESSGNPKAVSKAGARGPTGIMPDTAKGLGLTDLNDPAQQIYGGAKYLAEGLDKEGDPEKALLYYHGGPDWRGKYGPESAAYVPAVTAKYRAITTKATPTPAPVDDPFTAALKAAGQPSLGEPKSDPFSDALDVAAKQAPPAQPKPAPDPGFDENGIALNPSEMPPDTDAVRRAAGATAEGAKNVIGAAAEGAVTGFGGSPLGLSPQSEGAMVRAGIYNGPNEFNPLKGINRAIINPLAAAGDLAVRGGSALLRAYQRGVSQAGAEIGQPQLGRDLAALPEAFPTGDARGGTLLPAPAPRPLEPGQSPRLISERFAPPPEVGQTPLDRMTQLIAHDNAETAGIRNEVQPNPLAAAQQPATESPLSTAAAIPKSVGAAASSASETGLTPKQELAYRSTAEGQKLLEPQPAGAADRNLYVQGSNPNAAEIEQTVNTARELKTLNMAAPEVSQEARDIAAANNDSRALHYAQTAGSDVDVANAKEALKDQDKAMLTKTWENKTDADAGPVIDLASQIKSSPDGRRPIVRSVVGSVTKELYDDSGKLLTDPEQLYGVRKHIDDLLDETDGQGGKKYARAKSALLGLKGAIDEAIEPAANGFGDYLKAHAADAQKIDEMEVLQKHEPKLFDAQNRMGYNKVQTMMRQIVDSRQAPGINPYKSITDDTMQRLWALRDDLRRSASAQELARAPGSDTAQNFLDAARHFAKLGGEGAAHGIANALSPGFGSMGLAIAKNAISPLLSARAARKQTARGMELLHPDQSKLHNPLAAP